MTMLTTATRSQNIELLRQESEKMQTASTMAGNLRTASREGDFHVAESSENHCTKAAQTTTRPTTPHDATTSKYVLCA